MSHLSKLIKPKEEEGRRGPLIYFVRNTDNNLGFQLVSEVREEAVLWD